MAVTLELEAFQEQVDTDLSDDALMVLVTYASEAVTNYAEGAGDAVHNMAAIRVVGYLVNVAPGLSSSSVGDFSERFITRANAVLRISGAAAILAPYRKRKGVLVS